MPESNKDTNPYEAPGSQSLARPRTIYAYFMMAAVVVAVGSAAALVVTRSSKTIPDEIMYMDRGPVPERLEVPDIRHDAASAGAGEAIPVMPPSAIP